METKDDRVILSDLSGDPPKLAFSLTIYEKFSISCYKGATKVPRNNLINGFTYKIEKYSQVVNLIEKLRNAPIDTNEELKTAAINMRSLLDMGTALEDDEKTKVKFLVEQLVLQSKSVRTIHQ